MNLACVYMYVVWPVDLDVLCIQSLRIFVNI